MEMEINTSDSSMVSQKTVQTSARERAAMDLQTLVDGHKRIEIEFSAFARNYNVMTITMDCIKTDLEKLCKHFGKSDMEIDAMDTLETNTDDDKGDQEVQPLPQQESPKDRDDQHEDGVQKYNSISEEPLRHSISLSQKWLEAIPLRQNLETLDTGMLEIIKKSDFRTFVGRNRFIAAPIQEDQDNIKNHCTLEPTSAIRLLMDASSLVVLFYELISTPYIVAFFLLDFILIVIDMVTILLNSLGDGGFGNAIKFLRFLKTARLLKTVRVLRLVRVLRIASVSTAWSRISNQYPMIHNSSIVFDVIKILIVILWLNHSVACVWYGLGRMDYTDTGYHWIDLLVTPQSENMYRNEDFKYQYLTSFHFVQLNAIWHSFACLPAGAGV